MLFYPPNVAGWPGGKSWIDSSTLMMRMRLPQLINDQDEFNVKPKDDDDVMMGRPNDMKSEAKGDKKGKGGMGMGKAGKPINADIEWKGYVSHFDKVARENLVKEIAGVLLQVQSRIQGDLIKKYSDESSKENFIKTATIQLMSTPEYQLC